MENWKQIAEQAQADIDLLAQELVHLSKQIGFVGNIDVMVTTDINGDGIYAIKRCKKYLNRDVEKIVHKYIAKTQHNK